jgi:hypothetical protein
LVRTRNWGEREDKAYLGGEVLEDGREVARDAGATAGPPPHPGLDRVASTTSPHRPQGSPLPDPASSRHSRRGGDAGSSSRRGDHRTWSGGRRATVGGAWPASEGREDGDGEGGRAPVAAEGEEGDGEREALRTRERREAAASVGGRRGGVGGVGFLGGCCGPTGPIRAFVAGQASGASAFAVRCIISARQRVFFAVRF